MITGAMYLGLLHQSGRPWLTKEWAEKRKKILRMSCEACGGTHRLTVSHDVHPERYGLIYARFAAEADAEFETKFQAYLGQFYTPHGFQRPGLKTFRPAPTETDLKVLREAFLLETYPSKSEGEIADRAIRESYAQNITYLSLAHTRTLCGKCAYHLDKKNGKI